eukprot:scaffold305_cov247-Pinguiococcus_pyrenoidosus.AAC.32
MVEPPTPLQRPQEVSGAQPRIAVTAASEATDNGKAFRRAAPHRAAPARRCSSATSQTSRTSWTSSPKCETACRRTADQVRRSTRAAPHPPMRFAGTCAPPRAPHTLHSGAS